MSAIGIFQRRVEKKPIWNYRDWAYYLDALYLEATQDARLVRVNDVIKRERRVPDHREIMTILFTLKELYVNNITIVSTLSMLIRTFNYLDVANIAYIGKVLGSIEYSAVSTLEQPLAFSASTVTWNGAQAHCGQLSQAHYLYAPRSMYSPVDQNTYMSIVGPHLDDGFQQGYVIEYNKNNGVKKPYRVTTPEPNTDTHSTVSQPVDAAGFIYAFQERTHDTPIDIYKSATIGAFSQLAEKIAPGTGENAELSYCQFFLDEANNGVCVCRKTKLGLAYSGGHLTLVFAGSGYETWGTPIRITTNPNPDVNGGVEDGRTRHYPHASWYRQIVGNYIYFFMTERADDAITFLGHWSKYYCFRIHKTNFKAGTLIVENRDGSFSQDLAGSNYITSATLDANYRLYYTGASNFNGFMPLWTIAPGEGPDADIFGIHGETNTGNLLFNTVVSGVQTIKPLNIPGYDISPQTSQNIPVSHLCKIDNYIECSILVGTYPNRRSKIFRTFDYGDTWIDYGDPFADVPGEVYHITFPFNYPAIPQDTNFAIMAFNNATDVANRNNVFIKRCAKGVLQAEIPTVVIPAVSLSDANNLFYYRGTSAALVKTGNNITTLIDQFGLRNASCGNSPQWIPEEEAINFNGIDQYATIVSTGLTTLTQSTLFAIAKGPLVLLSLNNNLVAAARVYWSAGDPNVARINYKESAGSTLWEEATTVTNDGNYHLYVFTNDHRSKYDMYIDGPKEFYKSMNYTTIAQINTRGKINYGTVNAVQIALINSSGTDTLTPGSLKALMFKNNLYTYTTLRSLEKKFAEDNGFVIASYGYQ